MASPLTSAQPEAASATPKSMEEDRATIQFRAVRRVTATARMASAP
jgi:hypothetical protein